MGANYFTRVLTETGEDPPVDPMRQADLFCEPFEITLHKGGICVTDRGRPGSAVVYPQQGHTQWQIALPYRQVDMLVEGVTGGVAMFVDYYVATGEHERFIGWSVLDEPDGAGDPPWDEVLTMLAGWTKSMEAALAIAEKYHVRWKPVLPVEDYWWTMRQFDGGRFETEPEEVLTEMQKGYEVRLTRAAGQLAEVQRSHELIQSRLDKVNAMLSKLKGDTP